jgi:chromosome segregation ATPase
MLKKVVIAGLAVVVGVVVLAFVSPALFDWVCHQGKAVKEGAEDLVPLQQRIEILRDKLHELVRNKSTYYDQAAKQSVEVEKLTGDVATSTKNLADQWSKIEAIRNDLDNEKTRFIYRGVEYKRAEVEKQLKQDFDSYKTAEAALDAKKDLLSAKKQALEAARSQLANMESLNTEMEARLEQMKADLERVQMREAQKGEKPDDTGYASLKADMDKVADKIAEREKALDLRAEFDKGPIDPRVDKAPEDKDILKQIDDYKAAKNGAPKTNVADKP